MKPETMLRLARELDENQYLRVEDRVRENLMTAQSSLFEEYAEEHEVDIELDPESGVNADFVRGLRTAHAYWTGAREDGDDPLDAARGVWRLFNAPNRSGMLSKGRQLALEMEQNEKLRFEVGEWLMGHFLTLNGDIHEDNFEVLCTTGWDELTEFIAQFLTDQGSEPSW